MDGYVGRITPEKDLHTWLHAAALVKRQSPQARFVVVAMARTKYFCTNCNAWLQLSALRTRYFSMDTRKIPCRSIPY
jgi:glycosyltransferase involved in cell wall biosynthesis